MSGNETTETDVSSDEEQRRKVPTPWRNQSVFQEPASDTVLPLRPIPLKHGSLIPVAQANPIPAPTQMVVVLDSEEDEEASRDSLKVHDGISLGIGAKEAAVLLAEASNCTKPTSHTKEGASSDSPIILSSTTSSDDEEVVDVSDEEGTGSQWIRFSRHPDRSRFPRDHSLGLDSSSESPEEQVAKKRVTFTGESSAGPQLEERESPRKHKNWGWDKPAASEATNGQTSTGLIVMVESTW